MKWEKKGLIFCPEGEYDWKNNSALTPTPILIDKNTIRVYVSFRDAAGIGRIGFVDIDAKDPIKIKDISKKPVLDIGIPGSFDDNGVILGDVIIHKDKYLMYYVGFQIVQKVKFLAFTGVACSDNGYNFKRLRNYPVLDRNIESIYIRALHSIIFEDNLFKIWYSIGDGWELINNVYYPKYYIKYCYSKDGFIFSDVGINCIKYDYSKGEYRIGRPRVYKINNMYYMFYTYGTIKGDYLIGYATSKDGLSWERKDSEIGISLSKTGWDSKHICYPSLIFVDDKTYMFYNGNDFGKTGFGYAELVEW